MNYEEITWENLLNAIHEDREQENERNLMMYIKYHDKKYGETLPRLVKIKHGDWVDLYTAKETHLHEGEFELIPLGISAILPEGYEAIIAPRSSTFMRYNVIMPNSIGIIDNSYNGERDIWHFPALALKETTIPKGTRICQFRLLKNQRSLDFSEVQQLILVRCNN